MYNYTFFFSRLYWRWFNPHSLIIGALRCAMSFWTLMEFYHLSFIPSNLGTNFYQIYSSAKFDRPLLLQYGLQILCFSLHTDMPYVKFAVYQLFFGAGICSRLLNYVGYCLDFDRDLLCDEIELEINIGIPVYSFGLEISYIIIANRKWLNTILVL